MTDAELEEELVRQACEASLLEQAKDSSGKLCPVRVTSSKEQMQRDEEEHARNMSLYGNPFGPNRGASGFGWGAWGAPEARSAAELGASDSETRLQTAVEQLQRWRREKPRVVRSSRAAAVPTAAPPQR